MRNYPTIQDIHEARQRLEPHVRHTPLLRADKIEKAAGCQLYLKPETLQITGAFKIRGALNKALSLPEKRSQTGSLRPRRAIMPRRLLTQPRCSA